MRRLSDDRTIGDSREWKICLMADVNDYRDVVDSQTGGINSSALPDSASQLSGLALLDHVTIPAITIRPQSMI